MYLTPVVRLGHTVMLVASSFYIASKGVFKSNTKVFSIRDCLITMDQ